MKLCLFFYCCLIACSAAAERPSLSVVFEHNPPFQIIDANNKGHGPIIDFAELLVKVVEQMEEKIINCPEYLQSRKATVIELND